MSEQYVVQISIIKPDHRGFRWSDLYSVSSIEEARRYANGTLKARKRIVRQSDQKVVQ